MPEHVAYHSIAIANVRALPINPIRTRVQHLNIEVAILDDMTHAYQRVRQLGFDMALSVGQHTNDKELSFYALTPSKYRYSRNPKWPGAVVTALWWVATTAALPVVLARLGGYDRTYGSLAGVIVALLFFWLVGFGLVIGAQLNAALAETPATRVRDAAAPVLEG